MNIFQIIKFIVQQSIALFFLLVLLSIAVCNDTIEQIRKSNGLLNWLNKLYKSYSLNVNHDTDCVPSNYELIEHEIITSDNYILTTFKLCKKVSSDTILGENNDLDNQNNSNKTTESKCAVLLQHGMFQSSLPYILNHPNYSLAFLLVEQGYDVYLGNNRGNTYSRKHKFLDVNTDEFWDFSINEFAIDVEANINYIYKLHNNQKMIYVGHSQGAAQVLAALSMSKILQDKVKIMTCLAPGAYIHPIANPALSSLASLNDKHPGILFTLFGRQSFLPFIELVRDHMNGFVPMSFITYFAYTMFHDLFEWSVATWDPNRVQLYFRETPAGTSSRSVAHYLQLSLSGDFTMYDHGCPSINLEKYGSTTPLTYPIEKIEVPSIVVWGGKDKLINVPKLIDTLPNCVMKLFIPNHEHMDSLTSLDAVETIYKPLIFTFDEHCKNN